MTVIRIIRTLLGGIAGGCAGIAIGQGLQGDNSSAIICLAIAVFALLFYSALA